jgi:hypothetical protein
MRCMSARTSEVLPAPEGAAMTNSLPRACIVACLRSSLAVERHSTF